MSAGRLQPWQKHASDLCPGDVIFIDGAPVDIIEVQHHAYSVKVLLSDDPDDWKRWLPETAVTVVAHFTPKIDV